tara:strand:+ start:1444 stop:2457 length:1014 start_codon:yes stop_codon:yes gene_type:complete
MKFILVTGAAGFIGADLILKLLENGENVVGVDNLNSYYEKSLKLARIDRIKIYAEKNKAFFEFKKISINCQESLKKLFQKYEFTKVVHLAAQAGVRYSIENPNAYFQSNLLGFGNILESIKNNNISNFIFASSSSVYGGNKNFPYKETHKVDFPLSLYAATKKSNELMAYSYSHLYKIPTTGLRFFTVYGPWGRPDMAPMIFTKAILERKKIKIFNYGKMKRDFTYIDDIVEGVFRCCYKPASQENWKPSMQTSAPFRIFNIGNGDPVKLMDFVKILESKIGIYSEKEFTEMQKGDVIETFASISALQDWVDYRPKVSVEEGVDKLVDWYLKYYSKK